MPLRAETNQRELNVGWSDIVGLEDAKLDLKLAIVYPFFRPDLFPLGWPKGILLFGPSGCGKTMLSVVVAKEIRAKFMSLNSTSIMSEGVKEAERNIGRVFDIARKVTKKSPSIIFIDELDRLVGTYEEMGIQNRFSREMDKTPGHQKIYLWIIGRTDKPWALDSRIIRKFQKRIFVPLPEYHERLQIFKLYTKNMKLSSDVDLEELAKLTEGFSGGDIMDLCQFIQIKVNDEFFQRIEERIELRNITMQDFIETLDVWRPIHSSSRRTNIKDCMSV